jgi:hypothetical protein
MAWPTRFCARSLAPLTLLFFFGFLEVHARAPTLAHSGGSVPGVTHMRAERVVVGVE